MVIVLIIYRPIVTYYSTGTRHRSYSVCRFTESFSLLIDHKVFRLINIRFMEKKHETRTLDSFLVAGSSGPGVTITHILWNCYGQFGNPCVDDVTISIYTNPSTKGETYSDCQNKMM